MKDMQNFEERAEKLKNEIHSMNADLAEAIELLVASHTIMTELERYWPMTEGEWCSKTEEFLQRLNSVAEEPVTSHGMFLPDPEAGVYACTATGCEWTSEWPGEVVAGSAKLTPRESWKAFHYLNANEVIPLVTQGPNPRRPRTGHSLTGTSGNYRCTGRGCEWHSEWRDGSAGMTPGESWTEYHYPEEE